MTGLRSILALSLASVLCASCGDGPSCPPDGPPPLEDCLAGSDERGCELPLTIAEGPLETTAPYFDCSDFEWTPSLCLEVEVAVMDGPVVTTFRNDGFWGDYFTLTRDIEGGRARFCRRKFTDVYASGCPVGVEDWECAVGGTVTIEQDPDGFEPRTELVAVFADGGVIETVWW